MKPEAPKERDNTGGAKDTEGYLDIVIGVGLVVLFIWLLLNSK